MKSKKTTIIIAALAMAFLNAGFSFAAINQTAQKVCAGIDLFAQKLNSRILNKEDSFATAKNTQIKRLSDIQKAQNQKLNAVLEKQVKTIAAQYAKLDALAKTDIQKRAVETFKSDVQTAIKARRDTIDAANSNFRQMVSELIMNRKTEMENTIFNFKQNNKSALERTKIECLNKPLALSNLRSNLLNELKNKREKFANEIRTLGNLGEAIQPLVQTNKDVVRLAEEKFKRDLEAAKLNLKTAF